MVFSLLTVVFYTASSLGDKYISAKLACSAQEFSFLVALSTAFFLTLVLPFTGWNFAFSLQSGLALVVLVALKIAEFYTSAALLKTVSAYELKAWLSLNVIISYLVDLARGTETFFWAFLPCAAVLVAGIGLVAFGEKREKLLRYILLSIIYIASKFLYGLQMNVLEGTSPVCGLLLVMLGVRSCNSPLSNLRPSSARRDLPSERSPAFPMRRDCGRRRSPHSKICSCIRSCSPCSWRFCF